MDDLTKNIEELSRAFTKARDTFRYDEKSRQLEQLREQSQASDFWQDSSSAQAHMQALGKLESALEPWRRLKGMIDDLVELSGLSDASMTTELNTSYAQAANDFAKLKKQLRYSGPYDDHDVILSIHSGAGGTDAQDWAQMLARMYSRWADANNLKVALLEESAGEEAGIKSVSYEINGPYAFAKLKGEHGVHRLVRLSPFNANNLRQTSFAKIEVLPKIDVPDEMPLDETELKIDVYRAGGHGGQSVNTTDSAVRVTHNPTGITVSIQNERSQIQNKETALTILRSKLAQLQIEQHQEVLSQLKGPNQSAEWGNQIRSYVLHPYTMVKDLRTKHETSDASGVLDGDLNPFIDVYLESLESAA